MQITLDDMIIEFNPWTYMQTAFKPLPLMITEDAAKTARIEAYNDRKQDRIDRIYAAANNRRIEADRRIEAGLSKLDAIPFGQPVHGARDRNYRNKAGNQIDSGFRLNREADRIEERAKAAERNNAISSDDPLALEKLTAKLDRLMKLQERMKAANRAIKMKDTVAGDKRLAELGYTAEGIRDLRTSDFAGRIGYPACALQNNNQEIRRIKSRIEDMKARAEQGSQEWSGNGWTAETDTDENRIRIYFDEKPDEETRKILKSHAFKWSPKAGAWQRQITRAAFWAMEQLEKSLT